MVSANEKSGGATSAAAFMGIPAADQDRRRPDGPRLCAECDAAAKYTCPGCWAQSCSLACSKGHKQRSGCSGKRKRTGYVNLDSYDEAVLVSDHHLLEEAGLNLRQAAGSRPQQPRIRAHLPRDLKQLLHQAKRRGVHVEVQQPGMTRRRQNSSRWEAGRQRLLWCLHWRFPAAGDLTLEDTRVGDDTLIYEALHRHLCPMTLPSDADGSRQSRQQSAHGTAGTLAAAHPIASTTTTTAGPPIAAASDAAPIAAAAVLPLIAASATTPANVAADDNTRDDATYHAGDTSTALLPLQTGTGTAASTAGNAAPSKPQPSPRLASGVNAPPSQQAAISSPVAAAAATTAITLPAAAPPSLPDTLSPATAAADGTASDSAAAPSIPAAAADADSKSSEAAASGGEGSHDRLHPYRAVGSEELIVLMQLPHTPANRREHWKLDTSKTLRCQLAGKTVVEFPTLLVLTPDQFAAGTWLLQGDSAGDGNAPHAPVLQQAASAAVVSASSAPATAAANYKTGRPLAHAPALLVTSSSAATPASVLAAAATAAAGSMLSSSAGVGAAGVALSRSATSAAATGGAGRGVMASQPRGTKSWGDPGRGVVLQGASPGMRPPPQHTIGSVPQQQQLQQQQYGTGQQRTGGPQQQQHQWMAAPQQQQYGWQQQQWQQFQILPGWGQQQAGGIHYQPQQHLQVLSGCTWQGIAPPLPPPQHALGAQPHSENTVTYGDETYALVPDT